MVSQHLTAPQLLGGSSGHVVTEVVLPSAGCSRSVSSVGSGSGAFGFSEPQKQLQTQGGHSAAASVLGLVGLVAQGWVPQPLPDSHPVEMPMT